MGGNWAFHGVLDSMTFGGDRAIQIMYFPAEIPFRPLNCVLVFLKRGCRGDDHCPLESVTMSVYTHEEPLPFLFFLRNKKCALL